MSNADKHIVVWVQRFKDRDSLMLQWIDPDTGKRKSQSAGTNHPGVAEMKRTELEYELNHGLHKEASRMSWEKFRELFVTEHVSGARPKTCQNYSATFKLFETLCCPCGLRSITARTISQFVGELRKQRGRRSESLMESTIKVRLQFLRSALNWALKQNLIHECPSFPKIRPPKRKPQPVAEELVDRLLAQTSDPNMRAFLLCGWLAGLRLMEAYHLRWLENDSFPYLDLANNRIVFPAQFAKAVEDQWVPLDQDLRAALEMLPKGSDKIFLFEKANNCHKAHRQTPFTQQAISDRVSELAKRADVRLTMKSLRRGFGCYWAASVPAQILQKLMRHQHISTTLAYYANVDDAMTKAVLSRKRNTSRNSQGEMEQNSEYDPSRNLDSVNNLEQTP